MVSLLRSLVENGEGLVSLPPAAQRLLERSLTTSHVVLFSVPEWESAQVVEFGSSGLRVCNVSSVETRIALEFVGGEDVLEALLTGELMPHTAVYRGYIRLPSLDESLHRILELGPLFGTLPRLLASLDGTEPELATRDQDNPSFSGRRVLVCGGSRGVGAEIAKYIGHRGASVVVGFHTDETSASQVRDEIAEAGSTVAVVGFNAGSLDDCNQAVNRARNELGGPLTDLVYCAAQGTWASILDLKWRSLRRVFDVTAFGLVYLTQACFEDLRTAGGASVVALTSAGSARYIPGYGSVGLAKAGLEAAVRYLATELGPYSVRVNAVSPFLVASDSSRSNPFYRRFDRLILRPRCTAGSSVTARQVAETVGWLIREASMVTGEVVTVDRSSLCHVF